MQIGKNIRNIAFDKGITHRQLAKAAGISDAAMSAIIHGQKPPSLRVIVAVADELGCTLDELVSDQRENAHEMKS